MSGRVELRREEGAILLATPAYRLMFREDSPFASFTDGEGIPWAELALLSSVHAREGLDETVSIGTPGIHATESGWRIEVSAVSTFWDQKLLVIDAEPAALRLSWRLSGHGGLADGHLLSGHYAGEPRRGSGFQWSGAAFASLLSPGPSAPERLATPATEPAVVDCIGTGGRGRDHWFFTPGPLCFAMSRSPVPATSRALPAGPWLTIGLDAPPEELTFTALHFDAYDGGFGLRLAYEGQTEVRGELELPTIALHPGAPDPYRGIARYAAELRRGRRPGRGEPRPAWWARPIFCGWGAQFQIATRQGGRAADLCRQERYDAFLAALESHGLRPGTIVIDDKWQETYGRNEVDRDRWPDLRGWIDRRHAAGQRVLLWLKAWDPEGLPAEQCVRSGNGRPVATDPTHPAYEARLRSSVRRMLGAEGSDADGFKVDFTGHTPSGPGLRRHGGAWGIALLRRLLEILVDEARRTKPDALVITHTPNPAFADLADMLRLNDILRLERIAPATDVVAQMRHRARVVQAACPDALVDTDNWQVPDRAAWRAYLEVQPELGVPSLYFVDRVGLTDEPLEEPDWAALRAAWGTADVAGPGDGSGPDSA